LRLLIIPMLMSIFLYGQNLDEMLSAIKQNHPLAKSIAQKKIAFGYEAFLEELNEPPSLSLSNAYAKPKDDKSGYEYTLELSQNILFSKAKQAQKNATVFKNESELLKEQNEFDLLLNDISLEYHTTCLDQLRLSYYESEIDSIREIYAKKSKAYSLGEINKKELLELEVELDRLEDELNIYKNELNISYMDLEGKTLLELNSLSCDDLLPIDEQVQLKQAQNSIEKSYDKLISSYDFEASRYSSNFDSLEVGLAYEHELDVTRYKLNLSIPLNFNSYESQKLLALHNKQAVVFEKEAYSLKNQTDIKILKKKLDFRSKNIKIATNIAKKYQDELLPLAKLAYLQGESSLIDFLLYQRDFFSSKENLMKSYKKYYETLFELYGLTKE